MFLSEYPDLSFAVGECLNANTFELSLALLRYGWQVREIYGTVTPESFVYIKKIAALSPDTRIYTNLSPTMLYYDCGEEKVDVTIGMDAGYYHPGCSNAAWNQERQPFGYCGLKHLLQDIRQVLESGKCANKASLSAK